MKADYLASILNKFIDYRFKGIVSSAEDTLDSAGEFIGLRLEHSRTKKEVVFWVLRDEEGNGGGFVEVQEI